MQINTVLIGSDRDMVPLGLKLRGRARFRYAYILDSCLL